MHASLEQVNQFGFAHEIVSPRSFDADFSPGMIMSGNTAFYGLGRPENQQIMQQHPFMFGGPAQSTQGAGFDFGEVSAYYQNFEGDNQDYAPEDEAEDDGAGGGCNSSNAQPH